jgi:hypothetical protein
LLSILVLNHTFSKPFLDYEKTGEEVSKEPEDEEIYYGELGISGGIET